MELKEGTQVMTPDGEELGRVNRFVLDPETHEVTHIVVQKGWLLPEDKVGAALVAAPCKITVNIEKDMELEVKIVLQ